MLPALEPLPKPVTPHAAAVRGPLSLRRNFSWTFAGQIVYAACQWGSLIFLAKLGNPEIVGRFGLGLAIAAPIMMFAGLQLRGVQATDARNQFTFGDYLGLTLIATTLGLLVTMGFALGTESGETVLVIVVIGVGKALTAVMETYFGLFQRHERMDRIAVALALQGVLSLAALGFTLWFTGSLLWASLAWALAPGITLAIRTIPDALSLLGNATAMRPQWRSRTLFQLAWLALPLGLVMMLISLNANLPRYFIVEQSGEHDLGIFTALAYLLIAGNTVVLALGQSASPRLARLYAADDLAAFKHLLLRLVGVGIAGGVLAVLLALVLGRPFLALLYTPEYATHHNVLVWLMVGAGLQFVSSFLGYAITAARYFKASALLFAACTLVTLGACSVLVPRLGLVGAAVSVVIASGFQLLGSVLIVALALRAGERGLSHVRQ